MNGARYYALKVGAIPALVALIGFYLAGVSYAQHNHTMHRSTPLPAQQAPAPKAVTSPPTTQPKADVGLQAIYTKQLPVIQEALAQAIRHLEAGHRQEALTEMRQVEASLEALHQALGKQVGPLFLNDRCPIMGAKIDSGKVPADLTRVYGQGKVAFCCGGCPAQWDQLTAAEKTAKLQAVAAAPQRASQGMTQQP